MCGPAVTVNYPTATNGNVHVTDDRRRGENDADSVQPAAADCD